MIKEIKTIQANDYLREFERDLKIVVKDFQDMGLEVEIQYKVLDAGRFDKTYYSALVIGRVL